MFKKSVFSKFYLSVFSLLLTGFLLLTVLVNIPLQVNAAQSYYNFPLLIGIPDTLSDVVDSTMVNHVKNSYISLLANQYSYDVSDKYFIICSHSPNSTIYNFTAFSNPSIEVDYDELIYYNQDMHYIYMSYDTSTGNWVGPSFVGGYVNNWAVNFRDLWLYGSGWLVAAAESDYYGSDLTDDNPYDLSIHVWTDDPALVSGGTPEVTPIPNNPDLDNPEIDNPTPSSPPSMPQYDPTISVPENIGNWFSWLGSLITYNFNNLFTNIKGFFNNLFNNLKSWLTTIKDVIYNGFKNVIDNFTSLFKPFLDKVSAFVDKVIGIVDHILDIGTVDGVFNIANILKYLFVPEVSSLTATFLVHDDFGLVNLFTAAWTFLQSNLPTLYNLPPTYTLHIPSCIYHGQQIGDFDVSFAWFQPYKSYTDLIISAFLVLGWIYWLVTSASGLLRGNTSVISDLSPSKTDEKGG